MVNGIWVPTTDSHCFSFGDRVRHMLRGEGTVLGIMTHGEMAEHLWALVGQRLNKLAVGDYLEIAALGDENKGELGRVVSIGEGINPVALKVSTGDRAGRKYEYSREDVKHLPNLIDKVQEVESHHFRVMGARLVKTIVVALVIAVID